MTGIRPRERFVVLGERPILWHFESVEGFPLASPSDPDLTWVADAACLRDRYICSCLQDTGGLEFRFVDAKSVRDSTSAGQFTFQSGSLAPSFLGSPGAANLAVALLERSASKPMRVLVFVLEADRFVCRDLPRATFDGTWFSGSVDETGNFVLLTGEDWVRVLSWNGNTYEEYATVKETGIYAAVFAGGGNMGVAKRDGTLDVFACDPARRIERVRRFDAPPGWTNKRYQLFSSGTDSTIAQSWRNTCESDLFVRLVR